MICITVFILLVVSLFIATKWTYWTRIAPTEVFASPLKNSLKIFYANQSQHSDPVQNCWYDSGDYLVFLHRNVESLYYLTLAYQHAQKEETKSDLKSTIGQQLECVDAMISANLKQFRDQSSHGIALPPLLDSIVKTSPTYELKEDEGIDVMLILAAIYKIIGDSQKQTFYSELAQTKTSITQSENCCEGGPVVIADTDLRDVISLFQQQAYEHDSIWGIHFSSLEALSKQAYPSIQGVLSFVDQTFNEKGFPFNYLGGNYDIAGTIALERLYARQTGDESFFSLSERLMNYLHGDNFYQISFVNVPNLYHPCSFFFACSLPETLTNGVDESDTWNSQPQHLWRTHEVQLPGQARYILASVLFYNW